MDGLPCSVEGCEGRIEANAQIWFALDASGRWTVFGVGDEAATITCDDAGHDNETEILGKSLTAFIDELLPGSTWQSSAYLGAEGAE